MCSSSPSHWFLKIKKTQDCVYLTLFFLYDSRASLDKYDMRVKTLPTV